MTQEGVAVFPPLFLGRAAPRSAASDSKTKGSSGSSMSGNKGKEASPVVHQGNAKEEEEPVFANGVYTLRFSSRDVSQALMKVNVVGGDGSGGGKKSKK